MDSLETVAPAFVDMAHQIVWATAATVNSAGEPATRILHPIWEWDGDNAARLDRHLAAVAQGQAPGAAADDVVDVLAAEPRHLHGPLPHRVGRHAGGARGVVGRASARHPNRSATCPRSFPRGTSPAAPAFGALELDPVAIRVMEGSKMAGGDGLLLEWRAS